MAVTLPSEENPILKVYEFFREAGLQRVDTADFFGFRNLKLRTISSAYAQELIQQLRHIEGALSRCRLTLHKFRLLDFVPVSPTEWLNRETLEEFGEVVCVDCRDVLNSLLDGLEAFQAGASWTGENLEKDTLSVLDQLSNCQSCGEAFELDLRLDKDVLIRQCLCDGFTDLKDGISTLLWYDSESLTETFDSFESFLVFILEKAKKPIVVFFYASSTSYPGDFFKIFSLTDSTVKVSQREELLAQYLSALSAQTLADYKLLCTKYANENRPQGRLNLPPSVFLQRKGELAQYPSQPVFDGGPIRSVLIYAIMSWLATKSWLDNQIGHFNLPTRSTEASDLLLNFSLADVRLEETSIFNTTSDWRAVIALVVREIGLSIGNETLRQHWSEALKHRGTEDFKASEFFEVIEAVFRAIVKSKEEAAKGVAPIPEPVVAGIDEEKRVAASPELVDILVFLDPENREIKFHLNGVSLGYVYEPVGGVRLGAADPDLRAAELSELARDHLSRILVPDKTKVRPTQIPSIDKLKTRGVALWRKLIPDDLKRAYLKLRQQSDLTIFIVSDDPSFPWELVRPVEITGRISAKGFDDMWWAVKFSIARWLSGSPPPAKDIALDRICCIATEKQLAAAALERDHLQKIGQTVYLPQTYKDLITALSTQDYDVIHFACHGDFDTDQPGESLIMLRDGTKVRPDDFLTEPIMFRFNQNHPLVFLNSCNSGRTGATLIGIAGWAEEFIKMGCGAFIGCGWEVNDQLAADFAIAFYDAFQGGQSLGKAVHQARVDVRAKDEDNSTWLAYYLYGNPNCLLRK